MSSRAHRASGKRLYFRVVKFQWIILSLYGLFFSLIMSFIALV